MGNNSSPTLDYRQQRRVTPERRDTKDVSLTMAQLTAWRVSRPRHRKGGPDRAQQSTRLMM